MKLSSLSLSKLMIAPISAITILLGSVSPASAASANFNFGIFLTGTGGGGWTQGDASSETFAKLSVQTSDYLTFSFDLQLINLDSVFGSGAFVSRLEVNTFNVDPISSTIASGDWGVQTVNLSTSSSNSGGLSWDFTDTFCGNGCSSGNNDASRLTENEQVKWTTVFATVQNPPFQNPPFMLHVQGYGNDDSSKWTPVNPGVPFTTPIPEPEIYAMMGLGLGLMGFVARRRKQQAAA